MLTRYLLQYLYVSKVRNNGTTFISTNYPTYREWSDMLLRERQKYDSNEKCFGKWELVNFDDVQEVNKACNAV